MYGCRLLVALSAAVLTIGWSSSALAQGKAPAGSEKGAPAAAAAKPAGDKGKKTAGRKVLRLEEMRVEGRIQKPQAMFLMPRASVNSGEQERTESFLDKTKDAVDKDPF